jgi:putative FmdB family regulatory protein
MPIYEFACQDCGHEFEKIQSFSDSSTPACPNCQGLHVQRRLSAPAIHFKGSGWYITDSKNAAKKSVTGSTSNEEGKADGVKGDSGKADSKSDSKSEGKADSKSEGKSEGKSESGKSESTPAAAAAKAD